MGSPRALKETGPFVCWPKRANDTFKRAPKAAGGGTGGTGRMAVLAVWQHRASQVSTYVRRWCRRRRRRSGVLAELAAAPGTSPCGMLMVTAAPTSTWWAGRAASTAKPVRSS